MKLHNKSLLCHRQANQQYAACITLTFTVDMDLAQIPLRRLCNKVPDKFPTKSRTQIMKVRDTNHVANFHDLCL